MDDYYKKARKSLKKQIHKGASKKYRKYIGNFGDPVHPIHRGVEATENWVREVGQTTLKEAAEWRTLMEEDQIRAFHIVDWDGWRRDLMASDIRDVQITGTVEARDFMLVIESIGYYRYQCSVKGMVVVLPGLGPVTAPFHCSSPEFWTKCLADTLISTYTFKVADFGEFNGWDRPYRPLEDFEYLEKRGS